MKDKKIKVNHPTKKEMKEYIEFLDEAGKNFKLTALDLSNLFDLFYMVIPEYESTLKLNKMDKWFDKLFNKIDEIVLADSPEDYKKILTKLKKEKNGRVQKKT
ncbi:MAG: hypothetical protein WC758_07860 [Candidatus Woesearchaeota archaeon]|jgi:hypothetical protein